MPSEDLAGASCSIPIHPQPQPLTLLARLTPAHIASVACPVPSTPALCLNTSTGYSASHKPPEATAFRCPLPGRRRRRGPDYAQLHGHRRASGDDGQVLPRVRRPDDFLSDVRASTILPLGYMHVSYMHVSRKFVDYDLDAGAAPETRQIEERDTIREIRSDLFRNSTSQVLALLRDALVLHGLHASATAQTSLWGTDRQPEGRGDGPYDGVLRGSRFHAPD